MLLLLDFTLESTFAYQRQSFQKWILGIAVVLVGLFKDFRAELDWWSAVALKSLKSPL
ncbi:hypothetical protein [Helicobacter zhangjianzhongii]|uniref:Uncharacterized protein n=1 Tax=Helicobacter zhangjianzhongii TaxID=2974574 RepID=A0ACC6FQS0_9HELI|nr:MULTISPECIES: hypothetical protein [unclassified Helicobacter]MDL0079234.1 hypothetical protein [Helicobacter sp. CPD2-1]MDL0081263.1 hypothetical protein [Helicobacter sp. XJK30-2]